MDTRPSARIEAKIAALVDDWVDPLRPASAKIALNARITAIVDEAVREAILTTGKVLKDGADGGP